MIYELGPLPDWLCEPHIASIFTPTTREGYLRFRANYTGIYGAFNVGVIRYLVYHGGASEFRFSIENCNLVVLNERFLIMGQLHIRNDMVMVYRHVKDDEDAKSFIETLKPALNYAWNSAGVRSAVRQVILYRKPWCNPYYSEENRKSIALMVIGLGFKNNLSGTLRERLYAPHGLLGRAAIRRLEDHATHLPRRHGAPL